MGDDAGSYTLLHQTCPDGRPKTSKRLPLRSNRPRKVPDWKTPAEVFAEQLHSHQQSGVASDRLNPPCTLEKVTSVQSLESCFFASPKSHS